MFQSILLLFGRICISSLFLWAGFEKIMGLEGTVNYMASKQMPYIYFFLLGALILQLIGGFLLLIGYKMRLGALMLIIFIIPASVIFHDFWNLQGNDRLIEQIMFMKDVAILGGLLAFLAVGPRKYAIDT